VTRVGNLCGTFALCVTLLACATGSARAQGAKPLTVRVHVVGPYDAPVAGAELSVVHSLTRVAGRTTTDSAGRATLIIARDSANATDFNVIVRKIGFERADRFVAASTLVASFDIKLTAVAQQLPTTTVPARGGANRRKYFR